MASLSFASRFYCVTENAIMVVDTAGDTPRLVVAAELDDCDIKRWDRTVRLVDDEGGLILVHRIHNHNTLRERHEVRRVDLEARTTLPLEELGGRGLFIGNGYNVQAPAILLPARLSPYVRADTVYLCIDQDGGRYWLTNSGNDLDDRPIIKAYRLPYGRIRGGIGDDAQSCSVVEYVSRYVCGSKIIVEQRRRSQRVMMRHRQQLIAHQCYMDSQE
jgi:hypothetical protein